jgi:long-chain acyl-CoA synthetase
MTEAIRHEDKPWLKHYQKGVPEHVNFETKCLPDFLERTVARYPDKTAYFSKVTK